MLKFAEDFSALDNGITVQAEYQGNYIDPLNKLVAGKSPEVTAADWEFIKYLQSPEQWAAYDKLTGYIPIQADVEAAIADVIAADPRRQVAIDQFYLSRWHMRIHYSSARGDEAIKDAWNEIVQTDVDPAERLQRL
jgi:ABC-type glycerol-3-phosphate transport system substrate-binding protein